MAKCTVKKQDKKITLSYDQGTLLLTGLSRRLFPEAAGESCLWSWDARIGTWRCDAIYYAQISKTLFSRFGTCFSDTVMKPQTISLAKIILPELRQQQKEALSAWSGSGCRGHLWSASTVNCISYFLLIHDIILLPFGRIGQRWKQPEHPSGGIQHRAVSSKVPPS